MAVSLRAGSVIATATIAPVAQSNQTAAPQRQGSPAGADSMCDDSACVAAAIAVVVAVLFFCAAVYLCYARSGQQQAQEAKAAPAPGTAPAEPTKAQHPSGAPPPYTSQANPIDDMVRETNSPQYPAAQQQCVAVPYISNPTAYPTATGRTGL